MVDNALLAKILKDAMKAGKSPMGAKESIAGMKGSKALLFTRSVPPELAAKLRAAAEEHGVPVVELDKTSVELARLVGRPYRISAIALRSVGESDVKQLMR
ncbi:MAG: ribosomal L7Ae/L30e/S12e/Gadd45 family protein [archaeon]|nr:MAG: ribosomal L7Ae/L30e/S12e/Gadd45 family protein [archaeon]